MAVSEARSSLDRRSVWAAVCLIAAAAFITTNLPWNLEDYDQAKQAFTSLEMVQQGHWLYQHTPNGWVATKPPLVGWISAALFTITRSWDIAWRLPSLAAALALTWFVGRAAFRAEGRAAALLALAAVSLNLFAPRLATLVRTDMPLALITFLIGAQIWEKLRTGERWSTRDRWLHFALLTAAMVIKGPIIYVFLLPGLVAFEFYRRRRSEMKISAWCGAWPWLVSFLVFVIWVAVGIHTVPEFLEHVVIREFGGRFEGTHRAQPIYFYLPHLVYRFAPWSILLVVFGALIRRKTLDGNGGRSSRLSPETTWLVVWGLGGILAMSFIPSKRVDRIFPVVPPLALLLAAQWAALRSDARSSSRADLLATIAVCIACLVTGGYTVAKVVPAFRRQRDAFAVFGHEVCDQLAAQPLRLDVIGGEDEGMLLYLRKTEFTELPDALAHWRAHEIDAVVAPDETLPDLRAALPDIGRVRFSGAAGNHHRRYVFLTRR
ncbi:MAG: glycosyltransferase family 39 protein [Verrucomicrobiota bacterium]|nr:glycosyltransferase family 39 protein [Verrucomicrobiota bacterium]